MYKEKKCKICDKIFQPNSSTQKYCSDDCRKLAKNNRRNKYDREFLESIKIKQCVICGNEFEVNSRSIRKKYCSEQCRTKAEYLFGNAKQYHENYKDDKRFGGNKKVVLERDQYKCKLCGSNKRLNVHHIDCSGQTCEPNHELDNLITLCNSCHAMVHGQLRKGNDILKHIIL